MACLPFSDQDVGGRGSRSDRGTKASARQSSSFGARPGTDSNAHVAELLSVVELLLRFTRVASVDEDVRIDENELSGHGDRRVGDTPHC
jgi:hypothetical protein